MEIYLIVFLGVVVFFLFQSYLSKKRAKMLLKHTIEKQWGQLPDREYSYEEYAKISHYYQYKKKSNNDIEDVDQITWNDLDMDSVYMEINSTMSSVGEDYLYYLLRTPSKSKEELVERNRLIEFFMSNKQISFTLAEIFANIGRTKKISLHDYIYGLKDLEKRSSFKHYVMAFLLILSFVSIFYVPQYSIFFILIMVVVNIVQYLKAKAEIDAYFICFKYIVIMLINAEEIINLNIKELEEYNQKLLNSCKPLNSIKRGIGLLTSNNMTGSLGDIVMEYVRMLFHVDIIKFNQMLKIVTKELDSIDYIFETLGLIESMISIASYRKAVAYYCVPGFSDSSRTHISFKEIYHPLIENPVVNSLTESKGVLLTGSNASGKSTFLKTVAINAILAQTIYTCLAKEYYANFFSIYSSMALKDDLGNNESYYIVEIKSLKRILDNVKKDKKVLCFIDEVLRGTNTVERIAASSHILKSLSKKNVCCFAATHDIELTHMLEEEYANYHFQEEVLDNDIRFNYQLYKGRATSRNAIKLLSIIGYDSSIIRSAELSAKRFIDKGLWTLEN